MKNTKPVLLVEDDSIDAMTVRRAFRDLKLSNTVTHCINGEEALEYLWGPDSEMPLSDSAGPQYAAHEWD